MTILIGMFVRSEQSESDIGLNPAVQNEDIERKKASHIGFSTPEGRRKMQSRINPIPSNANVKRTMLLIRVRMLIPDGAAEYVIADFGAMMS